MLTQFLFDPPQVHMDEIIRALHYLKSNPDQGIIFATNGDLNFTTYCDTDWLGCPFTQPS